MKEKSTFEMVREKFRKAQAERIREMNKKKKEIIDHKDTNPDPDLEPFPLKKQPPLAETNKIIQLREELRNVFRQA
jgi:hypothetical protein